MESRAVLGAWGEVRAAAFLQKKGYRLLARNYRCRGGELDLVAEKGGTLAFVEVKTRRDAAFAEAREFVTPGKQERVRLAASCYLAEHGLTGQPRFDVVEVYAPQGTGTARPEIRHWENVF